MKAVSIIVPVYNGAPQLRRCLDSIKNQTFEDWEAICVDDGSTDGSGQILDEYAQADMRFVVTHQKNSGVNCTRQKALEMAHGRWIGAVDADDWIDVDFLDGLVRVAKSNIDMVWSDYYLDSQGESKQQNQFSADKASAVLVKILKGELFGVMWNKLLSREFVERHGISFYRGRIVAWEDLWFLISFLSHNPRIKYVPECKYHYVVRKDSVLQSAFTREKLDAAVKVQNFLEQLTLPDEAKPILERRRYEIKFNAYSSQYITGEDFYGLYKEIRDLSRFPVPFYHKILFGYAVRGHLEKVRRALQLVRKFRG